MASNGNIYELRSWMCTHKDFGGMVTNKFLNWVDIFMYQNGYTPLTQETGKIFYLCRKCMNTKFVCSETVWRHLVNRKFTPHYYILFQHVMVGMKLVVVFTLKMLVIVKNIVICILKVVTLRRINW